MVERTDWKGLHAEAVARANKLDADLTEAVSNATSLAKENDELRDQIEELRKEVERARIRGMHDATGLILRSEQQ